MEDEVMLAPVQSTVDLLSEDLRGQINQVLDDYQAYLAGLPDDLRLLFRPLTLAHEEPQENTEQSGADDSKDQESISPGKLSILAIPFWLGKAYSIEEEVLRRFALANIFGLMHFVALDKLVDSDSSAEEAPLVAIASALHSQQLLARYQTFFSPSSPFWELMEKYWQEWAGSMVWERRGGRRELFSSQDLLRSARKAAPLKICTSGLALLCGHPEMIPELEAAVDEMHIVMQMMDDLVDMGQDIGGERFNTALNMVEPAAVSRMAGGSVEVALQSIEAIGRRLFISGEDELYLDEMTKVACQAQTRLRKLGLYDWASLVGLIVIQARHWRDKHVGWLISGFEG